VSRGGRAEKRRDGATVPAGPPPVAAAAPKVRRAPRRDAVRLYAWVAAGSAIGGVARFLASGLVHGQLGTGFPWGTLAVNVAGSFLIGFYAAATGPDGRLYAGPVRRQFVMTGVCGGFTTFSVFSLETLLLVQGGDLPRAALNVGLSVVSWLAAVACGHALAARLNRLGGP
jgi:CrcB protein